MFVPWNRHLKLSGPAQMSSWYSICSQYKNTHSHKATLAKSGTKIFPLSLNIEQKRDFITLPLCFSFRSKHAGGTDTLALSQNYCRNVSMNCLNESTNKQQISRCCTLYSLVPLINFTCPPCFSIFKPGEYWAAGGSAFQPSLLDIYQWDLSGRTFPPFTLRSFHVNLAH